jgi:hypothetical protein
MRACGSLVNDRSLCGRSKMYEFRQPTASWLEQQETMVPPGVTVIVRNRCTVLLDNANKTWAALPCYDFYFHTRSEIVPL